MDFLIDQEPSSYELERGKPMPDTIHGAIQANISFEVKTRYRDTYRCLSETSLATSPDSTTPDIAIYPAFALDYENRTAKRSDAPLVCVEIQSPSQSLEEMVDKTQIYFNFGVKSCWIIVPAVKGIFVYDRPGNYEFYHGDDLLTDSNLDIEMPLHVLFE
jgi:Uma2 family endonuclease